MILGNFNDKEGKYQIGGKWYKPKWYANAMRMTIAECKQILEKSYSAEPAKRQKGILVCNAKKWDEINDSYASWVGLGCLHAYDPTVTAGSTPAWASGFKSYNAFIIHEYQVGKIAYLGKETELLLYFAPTDAPANDPVTPPAGDTTGSTTSVTLRLVCPHCKKVIF